MKAIILAAGMASRLRPLTDHKPKCLLEIGKQCLLGRAIEGLILTVSGKWLLSPDTCKNKSSNSFSDTTLI